MSDHPPWLVLAVALVTAKLFAELLQRLRLPPVLGELLAGMLLGNLALLGVPAGLGQLAEFGRDPRIGLLAEIGAVLLLFQVGLESDARELLRAGAAALRVAVVGVIFPFVLGYGTLAWLRPDSSGPMRAFVGAVLCATSVGITARVLKDLGKLDTAEARIILGAAVIDDVLGLIVLAVVVGLAGHGTVDGWAVGKLTGLSILFLGGGFLLGRVLARRLLSLTARGRVRHRSLVAALLFCFGGAEAAHAVGLAPIVGAFAAGLVLDPLYERAAVEAGEQEIRDRIEALGAFLVPIFFLRMGAACDLAALDPRALTLAGLLTVAAILGKQATAAVTGGGVDRWAIGIGMIPRGEVGLIVAYQGTLVRSAGRPLVDAATYAAVVVVVLATTLLTPPLLAYRMRRTA